MDTVTATVLRESGIDDCPILDAETDAAFREQLRGASDFSLQIKQWMEQHDAPQQVAWLKRGLASARDLFQPWTMEIVYAIAALETARFGQLEALLGIGSKTLTARLRLLQERGLVTRTVHDEMPVRITYELAKEGRAVAALAAPLFTQMNMWRLEDSSTLEGPS